MALTKPVEGKSYTLTNAEGLGQGVGAVPTGTVVVVDEVHKQPQAGVAGDVVVSFDGRKVVVGDEEIVSRRRVSLALGDFKRMFEESSGDEA